MRSWNLDGEPGAKVDLGTWIRLKSWSAARRKKFQGNSTLRFQPSSWSLLEKVTAGEAQQGQTRDRQNNGIQIMRSLLEYVMPQAPMKFT